MKASAYQYRYSCVDVGEPWHTVLWSTDPTMNSAYWWIRNNETGAVKKIGRAGSKHVNNYSKAEEEARRRNQENILRSN